MKASIIFPVIVLVLMSKISIHAEPELAGIPDMPSLSLTGVLGDGVNGSAIINGTVVKAGETISNVTLVAIENKGAKLDYKNKSIFLKIGGSTANGDGIQASQASISASNGTNTTMADAVRAKRLKLYAELLRKQKEGQEQTTHTKMLNPTTQGNPPALTNQAPLLRLTEATLKMFLDEYSAITGKKITIDDGLHDIMNFRSEKWGTTVGDTIIAMEAYLAKKNIALIPDGTNTFKAVRVKKPEDHQ